jgi:hypothetical protein
MSFDGVLTRGEGRLEIDRSVEGGVCGCSSSKARAVTSDAIAVRNEVMVPISGPAGAKPEEIAQQCIGLMEVRQFCGSKAVVAGGVSTVASPLYLACIIDVLVYA